MPKSANGLLLPRVVAAALRFLLYTGARKSEALRLKWEYVYGDRTVLSDSKTGPRTIWLAPSACAVLAARLRLNDCPFHPRLRCNRPALSRHACLPL